MVARKPPKYPSVMLHLCEELAPLCRLTKEGNVDSQAYQPHPVYMGLMDSEGCIRERSDGSNNNQSVRSAKGHPLSPAVHFKYILHYPVLPRPVSRNKKRWGGG